MSLVIADRTGGQVPLLKHAIMEWMLERVAANGNVRGDLYDIATTTHAAIANVSRALWDLQKQGLLTFHERKREGSNGHGSTTVLTGFALTTRGREWTRGKGYMDDLARVDVMSPQDLNPDAVAGFVIRDVVEEINLTVPPAQALANLLRRAPNGGPVKIRRANELLGYQRESTALYSLVKANPEAFRIKDGAVTFIGPSDWHAPDSHRNAPRVDKRNPASEPEPEREVEQDVVPVPVMVEPFVKPPMHPPSDYPAIDALVAREHKRLKAEEAAKTLESIGMDEQALAVLAAFPALSDLEADVLRLALFLGWA